MRTLVLSVWCLSLRSFQRGQSSGLFARITPPVVNAAAAAWHLHGEPILVGVSWFKRPAPP